MYNQCCKPFNVNLRHRKLYKISTEESTETKFHDIKPEFQSPAFFAWSRDIS